jgi:hypothetical protein
MTDAEKDAAWRSLPEDFKKEVRKDYADAKAAHGLDPTNVRIDMHIIYLERYFGKHNLTATEEEKPRFKVGDIVKVSQDMDWGSKTFKDAKMCFCNTPSEIVEIKANHATIKAIVNGVSVVIPLKDLIHCTEEQEPPLKATAAEGLIQMAKDEMGIVDNDTPKSGTPDWLAYRMELGKEVAVALIRSGRDTTFLAESTSLIVNGIVERLKGGVK